MAVGVQMLNKAKGPIAIARCLGCFQADLLMWFMYMLLSRSGLIVSMPYVILDN